MYKFSLLIILSCSFIRSTAQPEPLILSDGLTITPLSEHTYMHNFENSNGIIFYSGDEAVIVSTPPSDEATHMLINWVTDSLEKKIVAYIIDRWHPDAMEGLDVVKEHNIPSYAYIKTHEIAAKKGLPWVKTTFDQFMIIDVGDEYVRCVYLGEAHTNDGIIVHIPSEKVLFGGNEVRNYQGWIGNIADARLHEWSGTIRKVKAFCPGVEIVVPGHGRPGGPELLDYTIELYAPFSSPPEIQMDSSTSSMLAFGEDNILEEHYFDSMVKGQRVLSDATLQIRHEQHGFIIESDTIYNPSPGHYRSEKGDITILYPTGLETCLEIKAEYEGLFIDLRDDEVGMTIVIRSLNPR